MNTQISKTDIAICGSAVLVPLLALFSTAGLITNYTQPEWAKPLVSFFGGEEKFATMTHTCAVIFIFLLVAECVILYAINNILDSKPTVDPKSIIVWDDLSVKGNGHDISKQLIFNGDKAEVLVKHNNQKMIIQREEKSGKTSYKVVQYDDKTNDEDIKNTLLSGGSKCCAMNVDYSCQALQNVEVDATTASQSRQS